MILTLGNCFHNEVKIRNFDLGWEEGTQGGWVMRVGIGLLNKNKREKMREGAE